MEAQLECRTLMSAIPRREPFAKSICGSLSPSLPPPSTVCSVCKVYSFRLVRSMLEEPKLLTAALHELRGVLSPRQEVLFALRVLRTDIRAKSLLKALWSSHPRSPCL
jgi:hypothetical protein